MEIEILSELKKTSEGTASDWDEDFAFSKTVALTLQRLQPREKAQAKIKIQQMSYDIEFQALPVQQQQFATCGHDSFSSQSSVHEYNTDHYFHY